jgi:O-antigen ligase
LGSQNRYAQILIVILPFALCFYFTEQSPRAKLLAVGAGLLALGGLVLTFSRGAFVTLAGLAFIVMVLGYIKPHKLIPAAIAGVVLLGVMMPEYIARVSTVGAVGGLLSNNTEGSREADGSLRGRYAETMAALNVFVEHPIVGVGPGQFFRFYSQKYGNEIGTKHLKKGRRAHNLYLEIAADTGAFGIGTFLAIVFILIKYHWKLFRELRHRRPDLAHYAAAFVLGMFGYLGSGMFLHLSYQRYYWLLIALAGAAYRIIRMEAMAEAMDETDAAAGEPLAQRQIVFN